MNSNQNQSYSLLSQEEIDVLVTFLTAKKSSVNSDVLSQQSIDKLIYLITNDRQRIMRDLFDPLASIDPELLIKLNFRKNNEEHCELRYDMDENTGFIKLTAFNPETGAALELTPNTLAENDTKDWGTCISPSLFNRLARALSLKYTTETHEKVCANFAKVIYGDPEHPISEIHLPVNNNLLEALS